MSSNQENLRKVGKIKGSHGIKGEVFLLIFSKDTSWVSTKTQIHLTKNEKDFKPYSLNRTKPHKEGVIAVLDGVTTRNDSDLLIGQAIWVDKDVFISQNKQSLYLIEIEGFKIIDAVAGSIGFIKGFSSNTAQDLLLVEDDGDEYEIPFVKEFILNINHEEKIVETNLPEGLLDINSNSDDPDDGEADED
ncbi:MAG: 16S rRNA processing protein RimM [Bdellovibrionaceae bacterium]|nr:16S rRNA processing protein RimM [Pseudobdellovibrionaceae bacterium]